MVNHIMLMGGMPDTDTDQNILQVPDKKSDLINGKLYDVNGQILKWNKEKDQFE